VLNPLKHDIWNDLHMNRMSVEERRAQLVDAAMTIAVREGVEAVTIRGVAAEAGVSLGVVHYCFEDKDELLQAMGNSLALVASEPVRASLDASTDIEVLAHAAADALWEGLTPRRHMRLLTFEFATAGVRSRALRSVAHAHLEQTWNMTEGVLQEVARRAGVTYKLDMRFLARLVAGYIDGIEIAWLVEQDDDAAIASFHALADYVLTQVVPPVDAGGKAP
jgi:AcrR family transcriptional regulator